MDQEPLVYHSNRVLTASEIGSYLYCNRAWWLDKIGGYQPTNVEELIVGEQAHEDHGHEVHRAGLMKRAALALVGLALLLALLWVVLQVVS